MIIRFVFIFIGILFFSNHLSAQSRHVEVATNMGTMRFMLYDDTPKHRDAFLELAEAGHFNETLFYRVIQGFVVQGGSKDSKNAPRGKHIGYGDPERTVPDEILKHRICKKGALCAPRQPDAININKVSDISQFFIVQGRTYRLGQLDTLQMAVNRPIRNQIVAEVYTAERKAEFNKLKEEKKLDEARELVDWIKSEIEVRYQLSTKTVHYDSIQCQYFTTIGGAPELENEYTVFGEIIEGMAVIDKIAALKTDSNDRPLTDVKMVVRIIK
jgi:cyclophilin family peptidyl-prolyl cis-trans isomerase